VHGALPDVRPEQRHVPDASTDTSTDASTNAPTNAAADATADAATDAAALARADAATDAAAFARADARTAEPGVRGVQQQLRPVRRGRATSGVAQLPLLRHDVPGRRHVHRRRQRGAERRLPDTCASAHGVAHAATNAGADAAADTGTDYAGADAATDAAADASAANARANARADARAAESAVRGVQQRLLPVCLSRATPGVAQLPLLRHDVPGRWHVHRRRQCCAQRRLPDASADACAADARATHGPADAGAARANAQSDARRRLAVRHIRSLRRVRVADGESLRLVLDQRHGVWRVSRAQRVRGAVWQRGARRRVVPERPRYRRAGARGHAVPDDGGLRALLPTAGGAAVRMHRSLCCAVRRRAAPNGGADRVASARRAARGAVPHRIEWCATCNQCKPRVCCASAFERMDELNSKTAIFSI
jgi:hypothetical protein